MDNEAVEEMLRELDERIQQYGELTFSAKSGRQLLTWIHSLCRVIQEQRELIEKLESLHGLSKPAPNSEMQRRD